MKSFGNSMRLWGGRVRGVVNTGEREAQSRRRGN